MLTFLLTFLPKKAKIACFSGHIEDHDVYLTRKEFDNSKMRTPIPGVRRVSLMHNITTDMAEKITEPTGFSVLKP